MIFTCVEKEQMPQHGQFSLFGGVTHRSHVANNWLRIDRPRRQVFSRPAFSIFSFLLPTFSFFFRSGFSVSNPLSQVSFLFVPNPLCFSTFRASR